MTGETPAEKGLREQRKHKDLLAMTDKRQIVGPVLRKLEASASRKAMEIMCPACRREWAIVERVGHTAGCYLGILEADLARERAVSIRSANEIEQILGKALGYPWYKDDPKNFPDATEANGVCVGDHVPESLAAEAAARIADLQADLAREREAHAVTRLSERLYQESLAQAQGELRTAEAALAGLQAKHDALILGFVERVNQRAEAEMMRTGVLEGAHHRAIESELAAWLAANPAPQTEAPATGTGA